MHLARWCFGNVWWLKRRWAVGSRRHKSLGCFIFMIDPTPWTHRWHCQLKKWRKSHRKNKCTQKKVDIELHKFLLGLRYKFLLISWPLLKIHRCSASYTLKKKKSSPQLHSEPWKLYYINFLMFKKLSILLSFFPKDNSTKALCPTILPLCMYD